MDGFYSCAAGSLEQLFENLSREANKCKKQTMQIFFSRRTLKSALYFEERYPANYRNFNPTLLKQKLLLKHRNDPELGKGCKMR